MLPDHRAHLRNLLESLARLDTDGEVSRATASELEFSFRDCLLDLLRLVPCEFSEAQLTVCNSYNTGCKWPLAAMARQTASRP
jgi:hypothetical protein